MNSYRTPEIVIAPDAIAVQMIAAEHILTLAQACVAATGRFVVALAGGSTPQGLYRRLAQAPFLSQMPWERTWAVWGDERYVPHTDPASNYRMAREALLDYVPIPEQQVAPISVSAGDLAVDAAHYARQVETLLAAGSGRFDLVLLGIGSDGHTASLFPDNPALDAPEDILAIAVEAAPKPPPQRISLTAAALNRSNQAMFLATGSDKAAAVQAILRGPFDPCQFPAQLIQPSNGALTWVLDAAAARLLDESVGE